MPPRNTTSKFIAGPEVETGSVDRWFQTPDGLGSPIPSDQVADYREYGNVYNRPVTTMAPGPQIANPYYKDPSVVAPAPQMPTPTNPGAILGGSSAQPFSTPQLMQSPGMFGNSQFMGADPFGYNRSPAASVPAQMPLPGSTQAPTPGPVPEAVGPQNFWQQFQGGGK